MSNKLRVWWWNLRAAFWYWVRLRDLALAVSAAKVLADAYDSDRHLSRDEDTPRDAVGDDLSYWGA